MNLTEYWEEYTDLKIIILNLAGPCLVLDPITAPLMKRMDVLVDLHRLFDLQNRSE